MSTNVPPYFPSLLYIFSLVKSEYMKKFPLYNLPKTWNSLETGFRDVDSKSLFKYNVKSHLLSKYADYNVKNSFVMSALIYDYYFFCYFQSELSKFSLFLDYLISAFLSPT